MIKYGFACKTIGVLGANQTSLTLARANEESLLLASRQNLSALSNMLKYCHKENIPLMRISSDVIPLASHASIQFDWEDLLRTELADIKKIIQDYKLKVSMHPGQYTVLNSPDENVVKRAISELDFHARFLDIVAPNTPTNIVLHLGGGYGDKKSAMDRLIKNLHSLPSHILNHLALENDEKVYTIQETIEVCKAASIPAIFDVHHHAINPPKEGSMLEWLDRAALTWKDDRQKLHYSQQRVGGKIGMHSATIFMDDFLNFHNSIKDRELDVMLEVKDKNLSATKCINLTTYPLARKNLTKEWARYKYLVLERSQTIYNKIRELLKDDNPDARIFYDFIEKASALEIELGSARNAAQHVWGYFDKVASGGESKKVLGDISQLDVSLDVLPRLKRKLLALSEKYNQQYLLESLYFYI